ncbi:VOC family protein [Streptomyces sp. NPDC090022]|uniref:VOC family protein n=1 Tax=Streptomyces sp. NPDC090022 TaxID=3365920 RepID=UPI00381A13A6
MACRISELVIDCADPEGLAAFWSEVLGYVEHGREDDGSIAIGPPGAGFGGPQPLLVLNPSTDPRPGKLPCSATVRGGALWERVSGAARPARTTRPAAGGPPGPASRAGTGRSDCHSIPAWG